MSHCYPGFSFLCSLSNQIKIEYLFLLPLSNTSLLSPEIQFLQRRTTSTKDLSSTTASEYHIRSSIKGHLPNPKMPFTFIQAYQFACGCSIVRNDDSYIGLHWHTDDPEESSPESYLSLSAYLPQLRNPKPHYMTLFFCETYCRAHYEMRSEGKDMADRPAKIYQSVRDCWRSGDFERNREFGTNIAEVHVDMKNKLIAQAWLARYEADLAGDSDDYAAMVRDCESVQVPGGSE